MKGMVMKNKILLLSLLITAPAAIFAAAPAPLEAVVVNAQQRQLAVLQELQAVQANGVQLAAQQGFAAVAPYADYAGKIVQWGVTGVGAMALIIWRFGETVTDRQITLPAILLGGGVGVGFGIWRSEKKRQNLRTRAAQERASLQNAANFQLALTTAAERIVTQEAATNSAEVLRLKARHDLEAAQRRLAEESVRHQQEEQANREALRQESERHHAAEQANQQAVRDLAGQVGTNNQGLRAVVAGQLLQIGLQRGPALVAVQMLRQSGNVAEADRQQEALTAAETAVERLTFLEQQLALPATAAAMAALPASGTNS